MHFFKISLLRGVHSEMLLSYFQRTSNEKVHFCRSFDREGLGKISEKTFVELLKTKDDIAEEDISEMLEEYYR